VGDWSRFGLGRLKRNPWQPGPPTVIGIAGLGAAFGVGVLYVDWPFPDEADAFTSTGEYGLWLFLLAAQTALWALALLPLAASLRAVWRFGERNWRVIASTGSLALALLLIAVGTRFVSTSFPEINYPLPSHGVKLTVIAIIGSAIAIAGGLGMALVHAGLRQITRNDVGSDTARDKAIKDLFLLREHLERLLAIEGAIIGAAVLATAALRNAVLAYGEKVETEATSFPPEYVLIYGAAFSILLALVWAPIYSLLITVSGRLRDAAVGEHPADASWTDWHERRKKFEDFLGLQTTASASFRSGVAILTPLASGLLGLLFDT
jgi:hypothetical protein